MRCFTPLLLVVLLSVSSLTFVGCDEDGADEADGDPGEQAAADTAQMLQAISSTTQMMCECVEQMPDFDSEDECREQMPSQEDVDELEHCLIEAMEQPDGDPPDDFTETVGCFGDAAEAVGACEEEIRSEYDDICEEFEAVMEQITQCHDESLAAFDDCEDDVEQAVDEWGEGLNDEIDVCFDGVDFTF